MKIAGVMFSAALILAFVDLAAADSLFDEDELTTITRALDSDSCAISSGCVIEGYRLVPVDIDQDGQREYVLSAPPGSCGTAGCPTGLFMKRRGRWEALVGVVGSIRVERTKTNGFLDTTIVYKDYLPQGGSENKETRLAWNGSRYAQVCQGEEASGAAHPRNVFDPEFRGYCTWYAAERWLRAGNPRLPSPRDAGLWYEEASGQGYWTDKDQPVVGSLMVIRGSDVVPSGHVAYVETVDDRASRFTVKEMNFGKIVDRQQKTVCFNRVTERTLPTGRVNGLVGFIFPEAASKAKFAFAEELDRKIRARKRMIPPNPEYLYSTETVTGAIATVWMDVTGRLLGTQDLRAKYDEFYYAAVEYRGMQIRSLSRAEKALQANQLDKASTYVQEADRFLKLFNLNMLGASEAYNGNSEAATTFASGIYQASKASAKYGASVVLGPWASLSVDGVYLITDFIVDSSELGLTEARARAMKNALLEIMFDVVKSPSLGNKTLSEVLSKPTTQAIGSSRMYAILDEILQSPDFEKAFMTVLAKSGAHVTTEVAKAITRNVVLSSPSTLPTGAALIEAQVPHPGSNRGASAYYPLEEGVRREYQLSSTTLRVNFRSNAGTNLAKTTIRNEQVTPIRWTTGAVDFIREDGTGVYWLGYTKPNEAAPHLFREPWQLLRYPIEPGSTWTSVGALVLIGELNNVREPLELPVKSTIEAVGDPVTVPVGRFENCVRVGTVGQGQPLSGYLHELERTDWYCDGVGLVKQTIIERGKSSSIPGLAGSADVTVELVAFSPIP